MSMYKMIILLNGIFGLYINAAFGLPAKDPPATPKKWNIITIVTDDQGVWSVGAYGNKESATPNMDRLACERALEEIMRSGKKLGQRSQE